MQQISLLQIALFLAAAAIAAPLAKALKIGTVLGYLLAGVLIGPFALGRFAGLGIGDTDSAEEVLHFAEFGVVLLLFLIGLELRPTRLWSMRDAILGAGGVQVAATGVLIALASLLLGHSFWPALFIGLALALSSTAFALQMLEENGELTARHGRLAFAILLFQDLAAIPLIALAPFFAISGAAKAVSLGFPEAIRILLVIAAVIAIGRFVMDTVLHWIAATKVKEAMTASALLTVVAVVVVMEKAGLSASLGAFLAGALLAESAYRHEIEADIKPFEGLLLGLFFTAVGMSLDLKLLAREPLKIVLLTLALIAAKSLVLYAIGRWQGLDDRPARRMALTISQGGEFAFVLFSAGISAGVLSDPRAALLTVVVTLSMALTPALLALETMLTPKGAAEPQRAFDAPPDTDGHVIVAGFGRFGQIVARVLRAKRIPFTALDISPSQVDFVKRFGSKVYYGDAARLEVLEAAQASKARAFVLAIDDIEASLATAETVRRHFPDLPIYARARDRIHVHRLMDLGVTVIRRETVLSALDLTRVVLRGLGLNEKDARATVETFKAFDEKRLVDDYKHYTNVEKMQERARANSEELERLFSEDAAADKPDDGAPKPVAGTPPAG
jgi:glutathione-regulated potassium-efflux system protein KefB